MVGRAGNAVGSIGSLRGKHRRQTDHIMCVLQLQNIPWVRIMDTRSTLGPSDSGHKWS